MSKLILYGAIGRALYFQNLRRRNEHHRRFIAPLGLLSRFVEFWTVRNA